MDRFRDLFVQLGEVLEVQPELDLRDDKANEGDGLSGDQLEEIEELRRFTAELEEPEPASFTMA